MRGILSYSNSVDDDGNPAGGKVRGPHVHIDWQKGPLGRGEDRKEPNGAFVEDVIEAAIQRIHWYQTECGGKFACVENAEALANLASALEWMDARTTRREEDGVEGTHEVDPPTQRQAQLGDPEPPADQRDRMPTETVPPVTASQAEAAADADAPA